MSRSNRCAWRRDPWFALTLLVLGLAGLAPEAAVAAAGRGTARGLAIVGGTVVTMAGRTYSPGTVLIKEGVIGDIGGAELDVPYGYEVLDAGGLTVVPGLIDGNTHLGLVEVDLEPGAREIWKIEEPNSAQVMAVDGINPASTLIPVTRLNGVTTVLVSPGEDQVFSGQAALIDLHGDTVASMLVKSPAALHLNLGGGGRGALGSRMGRMAFVRDTFLKAQEFRNKLERHQVELENFEIEQAEKAAEKAAGKQAEAKPDAKAKKEAEPGPAAGGGKPGEAGETKAPAGGTGSAAASAPTTAPAAAASPESATGPKKEKKPLPPAPPSRDLKNEILVKALKKEIPVLVRAHRADDILTAVEIGREFGLKIVINHGTEAYKVARVLEENDVPVVVGPINTQPDSFETLGARYENAAKLREAGVLIAIQTGEDHNVRNLPYYAGLAAAYGLPPREALRAVTINPAKIFGIDDRYGSLEKGKVANLVLVAGDIFQPRSRIHKVFIRGVDVPLESRQTELYEKYKIEGAAPADSGTADR